MGSQQHDAETTLSDEDIQLERSAHAPKDVQYRLEDACYEESEVQT